MAEFQRGFELPKYGVLFSVRHKAKEINDLINSISIEFGSSICWAERYVIPEMLNENSCLDSRIFRKNLSDPPIYFKFHGNKFAHSLEFYCKDISVLEAIKEASPNDFPCEVEIKEGLC
jgi:hypothetical protein